MRVYEYNKKWQKLLTPEIVSMLLQIHEYKGEQNLFIEAQSDVLTKLVEIAKIQSTEASNKIEGIYTSDERLKKLVNNKVTPKTMGYPVDVSISSDGNTLLVSYLYTEENYQEILKKKS